MTTFTGDVGRIVAAHKEYLDAVFRESTQRTFSDMLRPVAAGGHMPVDTGFLRASFIATLNAPVTSITFRPPSGGAFTFNEGEITLVLAGADSEDVIYGSFTANYARIQEVKRGFLRLAAQKWPTTVATVSAELEARLR